ncbi:MAG: hypothetical protein WC378_00860 [Opitutaceae bacterium]|jgi:hypothetical protein
MAFISESQSTASLNESYKSAQQLISEGWKIISDGPSGMQLQEPRRLGNLGKVFLALGILAVLFFWLAGLVLMGFSLAAYLLSKQETRFFPKS